MKITKEYREFANKTLEGFKEQLRQSVAFSCACCQQQKQKGEAAGAHLFKPEDPALWKAMEVPGGLHRVGVYAICLECMDAFSEDVIQKKVIAYLGSQGLFGGGPKT
jgi:hypothetical protein